MNQQELISLSSGKFFAPDTVSYFKTKVHAIIDCGVWVVFVTSEKNYDGNKRFSSIRGMAKVDTQSDYRKGSVFTVVHQGFSLSARADKLAYALATKLCSMASDELSLLDRSDISCIYESLIS